MKACIVILPHWCCINTQHWDATEVLPCSSAAQSSYNDSHNDKVGNCATQTGKAVMLKLPKAHRAIHFTISHVYVAYSRVPWWYYILAPGSALITTTRELYVTRQLTGFHGYTTKWLFDSDTIYMQPKVQLWILVFKPRVTCSDISVKILKEKTLYIKRSSSKSHISLNLGQVAPWWWRWTASRVFSLFKDIYSHLPKVMLGLNIFILKLYLKMSAGLPVVATGKMSFLFFCTCKDPKTCCALGRAPCTPRWWILPCNRPVTQKMRYDEHVMELMKYISVYSINKHITNQEFVHIWVSLETLDFLNKMSYLWPFIQDLLADILVLLQ